MMRGIKVRAISIALILGAYAIGCSTDEIVTPKNPQTGGDAVTGGDSTTGGSVATGGQTNTGGALSTGGDEDAGDYMAPVPSLPTPVAYIAGGNFAALGTYTGISGHAQIIRAADGTTTVQLHVEGLTASTEYPAHVHALPCEVDSGGGHYMIDPSVDMSDESNEIWPGFTTDADGVGRANINVAHAARPDAQAIVIHDPAASNAKMACANLEPEPLATTTASGTFAPFAGATADEMGIGGTATLVRSASGTEVSLAITGLSAGGTYVAHVHAMPCAIMDGGGHYKIDPTIMDTDETNELWPSFGSDAGAAGISSTHIARLDAQSVVVHRSDLATPAPKVACADLVREEAYGDYMTEGTAIELADAASKGVSGLSATGKMTRSVAPSTKADIEVSGLLASTDYGIHVHDHSCALNSGGGHYLIDTNIASGDQNNEMWLNLTTDATGAGTQTVTVDHIARPEAAAIVIHDPDSTRVACIDLN